MNELETGTFPSAKIPLESKNVSKEYVLCLYYKDDSLKHKLAAKYKGRSDVAYRYWKSDADTSKGKYSKKFRDEVKKNKERK